MSAALAAVAVGLVAVGPRAESGLSVVCSITALPLITATRIQFNGT